MPSWNPPCRPARVADIELCECASTPTCERGMQECVRGGANKPGHQRIGQLLLAWPPLAQEEIRLWQEVELGKGCQRRESGQTPVAAESAGSAHWPALCRPPMHRYLGSREGRQDFIQQQQVAAACIVQALHPRQSPVKSGRKWHATARGCA